MLTPWEKLPDEMKNDNIKKYYDVLNKRRGALFFKRGFDIIVSFLMIVLLLWLFIILAVFIKMDSSGPVFYKQTRVTKDNKDFRIFKFRTMVVDADKTGFLVTAGNDRRITRIGSKIRKCRLDEIPQLFNILKGEMTFVGTRPEVRKYVDEYTDEMMATLLLPAGVTSLASISFRDEDEIIDKYMNQGMSLDDAYIKEVLPEKMKYNLKYILSFGFFKELKIMTETIKVVI